MEEEEKLIEKAKEARKNAYAPYSEFKVGAAVLTLDGEIYTGCNVENSSYGLSICAERVAIFNAVSDGKRDLEAVAVIADTQEVVAPCGACRQVIFELNENMDVIMADMSGNRSIKSIDELLVNGFSLKE
ncbi:MAG: cytidine deaminase [Candidatus Thermoplasmatota archaeon]